MSAARKRSNLGIVVAAGLGISLLVLAGAGVLLYKTIDSSDGPSPPRWTEASEQDPGFQDARRLAFEFCLPCDGPYLTTGFEASNESSQRSVEDGNFFGKGSKGAAF